MTREVITLFGPPGTGKTTTELNMVEQFLENGGSPERIAYCGFTRKSANEAADRAASRFGLSREQMPYFRTLHSIAFRSMELAPNDLMGKKDWEEFCDKIGMPAPFSVDSRAERIDPGGDTLGKTLFQVYALARARGISIEEEWSRGRYTDIPVWSATDFARELDLFKTIRGKLDFTDLLDRCEVPIDVDFLLIDEAQDLTPQQWSYIRRVSGSATKIVIAGDDDQAIFDWSGADSTQMRSFRGEHTVLPHSFRLPRSIHSLARVTIERVRDRVPKEFTDNGKIGSVLYLSSLDQVDLDHGQWFVLGRHRRALNAAERHCRQQGYVYSREGEWSNTDPAVRAVVLYERLRRGEEISLGEARTVAGWVVDMDKPGGKDAFRWGDFHWIGPAADRAPWYEALTRLGSEDMAYIRALLRRGESATKPGRITLSTIHGVKGGEADNVLLLTHTTKRIRNNAEENPDSEARVWYVGMTRARERLVIVGDLPL